MTSRRVPTGRRDAGREGRAVTVTLNGTPCTGLYGQSLAGVLLGAGHLSWRPGPSGAPRGVFCGIGVCFDCLVTVNGQRDVRACRRTAEDGDILTTQPREEGPGRDAREEGPDGGEGGLSGNGGAGTDTDPDPGAGHGPGAGGDGSSDNGPRGAGS